MYGKNLHMVRCGRDVKGEKCPGLIEIPLGDKGQCPRCGHVTGYGEHLAWRNQVQTKPALGLRAKA